MRFGERGGPRRFFVRRCLRPWDQAGAKCESELASAIASSRRERVSSLVNTLRRCHSTVRGLMNSWAPISAFVRPVAREPHDLHSARPQYGQSKSPYSKMVTGASSGPRMWSRLGSTSFGYACSAQLRSAAPGQRPACVLARGAGGSPRRKPVHQCSIRRAGPMHDRGAIADQEAHCWCRQLPFPISTDEMTEPRKEPIVSVELDTRQDARAVFGQAMGLVADCRLPGTWRLHVPRSHWWRRNRTFRRRSHLPCWSQLRLGRSGCRTTARRRSRCRSRPGRPTASTSTSPAKAR
jgi:hypothetical protein